MLSSNPAVDDTFSEILLLNVHRKKTRLERVVTFLDQATNQTKSEGVFRQACGVEDMV